MILRSLIIVAVLIGAVLAFAATRPDTFLIERSLRIKAPPEKIFALINNFHVGLDGRRRTKKTLR